MSATAVLRRAMSVGAMMRSPVLTGASLSRSVSTRVGTVLRRGMGAGMGRPVSVTAGVATVNSMAADGTQEGKEGGCRRASQETGHVQRVHEVLLLEHRIGAASLCYIRRPLSTTNRPALS